MHNSEFRSFSSIFTLSVLLIGLSLPPLFAQDATKPEQGEEQEKAAVIPDEPKSIDPASLVHPSLAKKATVEFDEATLAEIKTWLEEATELPVVIDIAELENDGRSIHDEYSDRLNDAPIYFLLNRLDAKQLSWYVNDEILYITTELALAHLLETKTDPVGDLLDAGFDETSLLEVIFSATPGPWQDIDQEGGDAKLLGDVLFINQTPQLHLRIQGLLTSLRNHGKETYSFEPEQHQTIHQRLQEPGTIDFQNEPLFRVVQSLSEQTGLDIRLDEQEMRNDGRSPRDTVSLSIKNRKLKTILDLLFGELNLTTVVENGTVLVTTELAATSRLKTVVYNISDLCKSNSENMGLMDAIQSQTSGPWQEIDQEGGDIVFPRYDVMVVRQTETVLAEVRTLLATYREAIKLSKPRQKKDDSNDVITHYYKLDTAISEELWDSLWILIPEGKVEKVDGQPENLGRVLVFPSQSTLKQGVVGNSKAGHSTADIALIPQSTMIITHYKKIHLQIEELIKRIEAGDPPVGSTSEERPSRGRQNMGGGQQGGYGGGGGFFSSPTQ